MRLGLSSFCYGWAIGAPDREPARRMDVFDFVRRAASHGIGLVQIADNLPLHALDDTGIAELCRVAAAEKVDLEAGTRGIGAENLRRYLALCLRIGSPILRVITDAGEDRPSREEAVRRLRDVAGEFEQARVILALENHDRFKVRELRSIIQEVGSPAIGICLDTVNSFGALEGIETVVDVLGPLTVSLHVKDFVVSRMKNNMGFTVLGTPAGKGMLDVPWLIARLRSMGRDCNAHLELWPPEEPEKKDTEEKEERWVSQSVEYLKPVLNA